MRVKLRIMCMCVCVHVCACSCVCVHYILLCNFIPRPHTQASPVFQLNNGKARVQG